MRMPILVLLLAGFFLALPGSAQDDADAEAPASPPPAEPADDGADGADGDEEVEEDEDDFEFSEEVPADEQLIFPVDI